MTDSKKYIKACMFAISEMKRRGSSSVVLGLHGEQPTIVKWDDALTWLDNEFQKTRTENENTN